MTPRTPECGHRAWSYPIGSSAPPTRRRLAFLAYRKLRNGVTFRVSVGVTQIRIPSTPCPFPWITWRRGAVRTVSTEGLADREKGDDDALSRYGRAKYHFIRRWNGSKLTLLGLKRRSEYDSCRNYCLEIHVGTVRGKRGRQLGEIALRVLVHTQNTLFRSNGAGNAARFPKFSRLSLRSSSRCTPEFLVKIFDDTN